MPRSVPETAVLDRAAALGAALADAAGAVIRPYFRADFAVLDKDDASPVTIADRESEAVMRRLINRHFPDHGIYGEEYGVERADADFVWVLDPIDGTQSFISGIPLFGTLIALLYQGNPVLGLLDQPISRERWLGVAGRTTLLNGSPVAVRPCPDLAQASLFTTSPHAFNAAEFDRFEAVRAEVKRTRYGTDCYAYGLCAMGLCDLVIEAGLKPYDFCAHIPIIEGAGGCVTDWQGARPGLVTDGRIVAMGNPALAETLYGLLAL